MRMDSYDISMQDLRQIKGYLCKGMASNNDILARFLSEFWTLFVNWHFEKSLKCLELKVSYPVREITYQQTIFLSEGRYF